MVQRAFFLKGLVLWKQMGLKSIHAKRRSVIDIFISNTKIETVDELINSSLLRYLYKHEIVKIAGEFTEGIRSVFVGFSTMENAYFVWNNKSTFLGTDYISEINNSYDIGEIAANYSNSLCSFNHFTPVAFQSKDLNYAKEIALKFAKYLLKLS